MMSNLVTVRRFGYPSIARRAPNGAWVDDTVGRHSDFSTINKLYKFQGFHPQFINGMLYSTCWSKFIIFKKTLNGDIFCGVLYSDPLLCSIDYGNEDYSYEEYSSPPRMIKPENIDFERRIEMLKKIREFEPIDNNIMELYAILNISVVPVVVSASNSNLYKKTQQAEILSEMFFTQANYNMHKLLKDLEKMEKSELEEEQEQKRLEQEQKQKVLDAKWQYYRDPLIFIAAMHKFFSKRQKKIDKMKRNEKNVIFLHFPDIMKITATEISVNSSGESNTKITKIDLSNENEFIIILVKTKEQESQICQQLKTQINKKLKAKICAKYEIRRTIPANMVFFGKYGRHISRF